MKEQNAITALIIFNFDYGYILAVAVCYGKEDIEHLHCHAPALNPN